MQVPISMNVVLPIIFGVIIILVAALLFRFVIIKNPPPTEKSAVLQPLPKDTSKMANLQSNQKKQSDSLNNAAKAMITNTVLPSPIDSSDKTAIKANLATEAQVKSENTNGSILDTGTKVKVVEKLRLKEPTLPNIKETHKVKKKKSKKNNNDNSQEKAPEEPPLNSGDEIEASMKPNLP